MDLQELLKIIKASKNPEWSSGLACNLVGKLMNNYRPDGMTALAEMTTTLSKL
jgi:hypothetical protein